MLPFLFFKPVKNKEKPFARWCMMTLLFATMLFSGVHKAFAQSTSENSSPTPKVYTDKPDYRPGETVIIQGDGRQPGERVKLEIDHSTVTHGNTVLYATADNDGRIYNDQFLIKPEHSGEEFTLKPTGQSSGLIAQTTVEEPRIIWTLSSITVCEGTTKKVSWTATADALSTRDIGTITLTLPAGFTFENPTVSLNTWTVSRYTLQGPLYGICLQANNDASKLKAGQSITFSADVTTPSPVTSTNLNSYALGQNSLCLLSVGTTPEFTDTRRIIVAGNSAPPVVNAPIVTGATSVSGTSTEPAGTTIEVFKGTASVGTTTVNNDGTWTKSVSALALNDVITARATNTSAGECTSASSNAVTVVAPCVTSVAPTAATSSENNFCSDAGGTLNLTASGGTLGTGAVVRWYTSSCGGTLVGTGNPLTINRPTVSTTYFARYEGDCNTTTCASVAVTVKTLSVAPTTATSSENNFCSDAGGTLNLTASGGTLGTGAVVRWYTSSCGGTLVGTGNPLTINRPAVSTTYFARYEGDCNTTTCASVAVTVKTLSTNPTGASATTPTICVGSNTNISVTGGSLGTGASWKWYTGSCGGTPVGTGATINVSPTATTTYYVRAEGDCNTTTCASVTVTVNDKPSLTSISSPSTVCAGSNLSLSAPSITDNGSLVTAQGWQIETAVGSNAFTSFASPYTVTFTDNGKKIRYFATNGCGTTNSNQVVITVNALPEISPSVTTIKSTDPTKDVQYSDPIGSVTITVTDDGAGSSLAISTKWKLSSASSWTTGLPTGLSLSAPTTGANSRTWTLSGNANLAPGTYSIEISVTDGFCSSTRTLSVTVTPEDARATYTGAEFVSTSSATSSTATITLSATIRDITAATGDPAHDAFAGDIRNARVMFVNRDANGAPISGWLTPGLVTASDPRTGTVTFNWSVNIGTKNSETYTVGIVVNNFYTRNASDDNTTVTVSKPLSDFITGGGFLTLTNATGLIAPRQGTKNNFGFSVKYNRGGTNLQGNINTIVRGEDGKVYQVKGNVMTSLSVNSTAGTATFNGRASIQDITDPLAPVSVDGNARLQVNMTDAGEPGTSDRIAITVWNKDGGLWFASSWDGTRTVQQLLAKGNLRVSSNSSFGTSTTATTKVIAQMAPAQVLEEVHGYKLNVAAFPNPAISHFNLKLTSNNTRDAITLRVFNQLGQLMDVKRNLFSGQVIQLGAGYKQGTYFVEATQGDQKQNLQLVKTN